MIEVIYTKNVQEDRDYWLKQNPKILEKIDNLIADIKAHPFTGLGKPEPLKFQQSGYWSRRITSEHRLVYKFVKKQLFIIQCRYHY
jgi:toxin YoeB